jgi:hypothetical protein
VIRQLLLLFTGAALFWVLVGLPARHLGGGDLALFYCGTGLLICLVPAALTLVVVTRVGRTDPQQKVLVVLGSTAVRIFVVLIAGGLLALAWPLYREDVFWLWLVVCYLFVLAVETALVLARP